ncbi:MAG: hypothetical protein IJH64_05650 [Oscillospiraceae bacterium]|nr:hypothetical protein [Clostridia bacterium]MBR0341717.1 hypothetical protein [Oscillospiraceae bacterium]
MKYRIHNREIDLSMEERYNIAMDYLREYVASMIRLEQKENDMLKDVAENRIYEAADEYLDCLFDEIEEDKDFIISFLFDEDPYDSLEG